MKVGALHSWAEFHDQMSRVLADVEALGVTWRGTRFSRYLRRAQDLASMEPESVANRPGERITGEALSQGLQLIEAARLFPSVRSDVLVQKLRHVLDGADVHDGCGDDRPRNTLFELTVAQLLADYGFAV